jgi:hypothetical protein
MAKPIYSVITSLDGTPTRTSMLAYYHLVGVV